METDVKELIRMERRQSDFNFIAEVIQRGRIRPSTYVHELTMPVEIYEDMKHQNLIDHEYIFMHKLAFFEFRRDTVIVSFAHLYNCEDFHHQVDRFIIRRLTGNYPIKRSGVSKMNFDKTIEPVEFVKAQVK